MTSIFRRLVLSIAITAAAIIFSSHAVSDDRNGIEMVRNMFRVTKSLSSLSYTMNKSERINGEMYHQTSTVKLSRNPLKVYTKQLAPDEGLEVLYSPVLNGGKALVNTNGFPFINLSLDPYGSLMRENQHHTIADAGYDHFISIMEHLTTRYNKELPLLLKSDEIRWKGRDCYRVVFNNPHFRWEQYVIKSGETIFTVARRRFLSAYMILEHNQKDDYDDVYPGEVISIPNDYSPRMMLIIDKRLKVPLLISVYDQKGLFEQYEFSDIVLNPPVAEGEFTPSFSEYSF